MSDIPRTDSVADQCDLSHPHVALAKMIFHASDLERELTDLRAKLEKAETAGDEMREVLEECRIQATLEKVDQLESELAEAQQWLDSEPDWKNKFMQNHVAVIAERDDALKMVAMLRDTLITVSNYHLQSIRKPEMAKNMLDKVSAALASTAATGYVKADELSAEIDKILTAIPAYNEGRFVVLHHDGEGNETGFEDIDPATIIQTIQGHAYKCVEFLDAARSQSQKGGV